MTPEAAVVPPHSKTLRNRSADFVKRLARLSSSVHRTSPAIFRCLRRDAEGGGRDARAPRGRGLLTPIIFVFVSGRKAGRFGACRGMTCLPHRPRRRLPPPRPPLPRPHGMSPSPRGCVRGTFGNRRPDAYLAPGQLLRRAIEADRIASLIFYGPPGTGKTSLAQIIARQTRSKFERLSGVESNVADMRRVLAAAANRLENTGQPTILFIDEIHRFNKAQQDVLLPDVESGVVRLIGATTHNPFSSSIRRWFRARRFSNSAAGGGRALSLLTRTGRRGARLGALKIRADEAGAAASGQDRRMATRARRSTRWKSPRLPPRPTRTGSSALTGGGRAKHPEESRGV